MREVESIYPQKGEVQASFEGFQLERLLGSGGSSSVWLAHDRHGQQVAIKFLPDIVVKDEPARQDLRNQVRRVLPLQHLNVVRTINLVESATTVGVITEYVEGKTLSQVRAEQPQLVFEPTELAPILRQVLNALEYIHQEKRIVHRDIKPSNIMIDKTQKVLILDFGISSSLRESFERLAMSGTVRGTLAYMSPQQMLGEPPTPADDIYAFGATVYDLLTGQPPFFSGAIDRQVLGQQAPTLERRRMELGIQGKPIPPHWEQVIAECLDKDPGKRPTIAAIRGRLRLESPDFALAATSSSLTGTLRGALRIAAVCLAGCAMLTLLTMRGSSAGFTLFLGCAALAYECYLTLRHYR